MAARPFFFAPGNLAVVASAVDAGLREPRVTVHRAVVATVKQDWSSSVLTSAARPAARRTAVPPLGCPSSRAPGVRTRGACYCVKKIHRELSAARKQSGFVRDAVTQCSQGRTFRLYPESS